MTAAEESLRIKENGVNGVSFLDITFRVQRPLLLGSGLNKPFGVLSWKLLWLQKRQRRCENAEEEVDPDMEIYLGRGVCLSRRVSRGCWTWNIKDFTNPLELTLVLSLFDTFLNASIHKLDVKWMWKPCIHIMYSSTRRFLLFAHVWPELPPCIGVA